MPSPWHKASLARALPIIGGLREGPSVSRCPLHRHEVCVFTPGSLSARRRIMGGSAREPSPHHSFGELISSSLWPAIICSPEYFMAHFRISASLYVGANLGLQQCLYCVISIVLLCSVPCKTLRLELRAVVITLISRCFTVQHLDSFSDILLEEMRLNLMRIKYELSGVCKSERGHWIPFKPWFILNYSRRYRSERVALWHAQIPETKTVNLHDDFTCSV